MKKCSARQTPYNAKYGGGSVEEVVVRLKRHETKRKEERKYGENTFVPFWHFVCNYFCELKREKTFNYT